jgi:hypothetical protein
MTKELYLDLTGIEGRKIQNTFWSSKDSPTKIAIFFSGYRYPTEAPLFHFLKLHFLSSGWAVLALDYRYNENEKFLNLSDPDQFEYLYDETKLMQTQLEAQLHFDQYCFVAKSLGTTILSKMLENNFFLTSRSKSQFIWLTPSERNEQICDLIIGEEIQSLYVIGERDPYYNKDLYSRIDSEIKGSCYLVPGAGHIFEHVDDLTRTMKNNIEDIEFLIKGICI